jgi:hypothetical protein
MTDTRPIDLRSDTVTRPTEANVAARFSSPDSTKIRSRSGRFLEMRSIASNAHQTSLTEASKPSLHETASRVTA